MCPRMLPRNSRAAICQKADQSRPARNRGPRAALGAGLGRWEGVGIAARAAPGGGGAGRMLVPTQNCGANTG